MEVDNTEDLGIEEALDDTSGHDDSAADPIEETHDGEAEGDVDLGDSGDVAEAEAAQAAYEFNRSYKVLDQEKEFPEWVNQVVRDEESEKMIRDLFERADGLDSVKTDRTQLREELQSVKGNYETQQAAMQQLGQLIQNQNDPNSVETLLHELNLNPQNVLQWALNYAQQTPEQRAAAEQQRQVQVQAQQQQSQAQNWQQQAQNYATMYRDLMIDNQLRTPEISEAVNSYDTRMGKPGAFRELVLQHGQFLYHQTRQDAPVEQVVDQVMAMTGLKNLNPTPSEPAGQRPPAQNVVRQPNSEKPVIPPVRGTGASPLKKQVRSIADLKERYQQSLG